MKEPSAPLGSPPVPAFLMKLWALLEDPSNNDVIAWNWDGQNFCILDDQRFSKEILPKYFKHNNLSSFIRQLNMYGFRKVMSLESGLVRSERASAIEFQHPYFKKGQAELLEHIKRKISSSVKPEDPHLSQDELQKVVSELQELKDVQSNMDAQLESMRRENQTLWKEVSSLRRKHSQQQKLLTKVLHFILSLMRGNIVMGPKRKRQLTLEPTSSPPPKYSRNVLQFPEDVEEEVCISSPPPGNSSDSTLQIHEIFSPGEGTSEGTLRSAEQTQNFTAQSATALGTEVNDEAVQEVVIDDSVLQLQSLAEQSLVPSNSAGGEELALDVVPASSTEDPYSVINSILNENNAASNDLVYREEIQDYISCIDASLEELQALLSRKKLNVDADYINELFKPDLSSSDNRVTKTNTAIAHELQEDEEGALIGSSDDRIKKDKQLMQYTGKPLISLFDLPSNDYGSETVDPANFLNTLVEDEFAGSSAMPDHNLPGCSSSKEHDLLAEDFSTSQEVLPLFVLSPVNKLIDEAKEAETL